MSAESMPPDDDGLRQLQAGFDARGRSFRDMAQPRRFDQHPDLAWGWFGHRERWYRRATPHDGYRLLRAWAQAMPCGSFVVTTNVDGQFLEAGFTDWQVLERHGSLFRRQCARPCSRDVWSERGPEFAIDPVDLRAIGELPRCPHCGCLARPNVLMYDDTRWVDEVRRKQQRRLDTWLASVRGKRLVVVEIGAGEGASSVRGLGERMLERSRASLLRINPAATGADEPVHVLRLPAVAAIRLVHESLPARFGGTDAAGTREERAEVAPVTAPMRLTVPPVCCVDMGSGLVSRLGVEGFGQAEDFAFLERYGEAQTGWVPVPPCDRLVAPGCTMTARVLRAAGDRSGTPGAALVFVQAADEQAVATFGVGRRMDDAAGLWELLYSTTDRPLLPLDCPAVPWIACRPAAGLAQHPELSPYLAAFARLLARAYLTFLAFRDAQARDGSSGE